MRSAAASASTTTIPAIFRVEVLTKSASTVDATKAALAEIAGLNTRPFTEDELDRAKDNILNSFLFRYDTRDKVLAEREKLEFYGYPADYLETYKAALEKVTLADLERVGKEVHSPRQAGRAGRGQRPGDQARPGRVEARPAAAHRHHHPHAQTTGCRTEAVEAD